MEAIFSFFDNLPHFVWNILLVVVAVIIGLLIRLIIRKFLQFNYRRTNYYIFELISRHTHRPAGFFFPLLMINMAIPFLQADRESMTRIDRFIEIALALSFAAMVISMIRILEGIIYHIYDVSQSDNLKARRIRTQMMFIRQLIITLVVIITIAVILLSFENLRKLGTGLLGGVAIGATIVGFAAQQSLGNLLAGFQIAFTQPIRLDDVLVVEGEWGRVEEITLTYVVLRIWDERRLILPINYFITKPFQNWTRTSSQILGTVFLYMDYSVPVEPLREELSRLLKSSGLWDQRVNVLQITDTKERTIEIRALMSARNSGDAFDLRCMVRENLIRFIEKNYPNALPKTRADIPPAIAETA